MLCDNIGINRESHLTFALHDTVELAKEYSTPLYLFDEERIRRNCRVYLDSMKSAFPEGSLPIYASKAACFKYIYGIMKDEGMGIDLVSSGEVYTAFKAGFPMERSFFHGSNKTPSDVILAMDCGVGYFIADNVFELEVINAEAGKRSFTQNVLLRLTPGIDPHTYEEVATGKVDSKFGVAIETGQAEEFVKTALDLKNIRVCGYHCHVGSQVFDEDNTVYHDAADKMLRFAAEIKNKFGYSPEYLDLGGGYGVRYVESDPAVNIPENIEKLGKRISELSVKYDVTAPKIILEPGRSIVADAGMTLYTVGSVKKIPGYKNYVSIDGGMTDNPRYALYGSKYTVHVASRVNERSDFACDLVGRCCESGDIIAPNVNIPEPSFGDIVAVCTTGAYNYSMASNYNRLPRPPIVMLSGDEKKLVVRRESLDDLIQNDI